MALENTADLAIQYVKVELERNGEAILRIAKEGMFQPPEEVIRKFQEIFRKRGLNVLIYCEDDEQRPRELFNLFIRKKSE